MHFYSAARKVGQKMHCCMTGESSRLSERLIWSRFRANFHNTSQDSQAPIGLCLSTPTQGEQLSGRVSLTSSQSDSTWLRGRRIWWFWGSRIFQICRNTDVQIFHIFFFGMTKRLG